MLLEELGTRIREARTRLGFTQNDLAAALQVSPQAVSKWERGENAPDVATLPALASLLGTSTDSLLGANWRDKAVVEATVVFADLVDFSGFAAGKEPAELAIDLNAYFYPLTEHMLRRDGVPVKYIGDEMLCVFSGETHRERAFRAVFAAKDSVARPTRFTLASGRVWMGPIGHPSCARPDVLGETVNAASILFRWARENAPGGVAATLSAVDPLRALLDVGAEGFMPFAGSPEGVAVAEVRGMR